MIFCFSSPLLDRTFLFQFSCRLSSVFPFFCLFLFWNNWIWMTIWWRVVSMELACFQRWSSCNCTTTSSQVWCQTTSEPLQTCEPLHSTSHRSLAPCQIRCANFSWMGLWSPWLLTAWLPIQTLYARAARIVVRNSRDRKFKWLITYM